MSEDITSAVNVEYELEKLRRWLSEWEQRTASFWDEYRRDFAEFDAAVARYCGTATEYCETAKEYGEAIQGVDADLIRLENKSDELDQGYKDIFSKLDKLNNQSSPNDSSRSPSSSSEGNDSNPQRLLQHGIFGALNTEVVTSGFSPKFTA